MTGADAEPIRRLGLHSKTKQLKGKKTNPQSKEILSLPKVPTQTGYDWPALPCWVKRVRAVAIFSAAVHVALAISTRAFLVGPCTHDNWRTKLCLTILNIQAKLCELGLKIELYRTSEIEVTVTLDTSPTQGIASYSSKTGQIEL